jgi:hypothetical protein
MTQKKRQGLLLFMLVISCTCWGQEPDVPKHPPITFIYPETKLPVKQVFDTIIKGFEQSTQGLAIQFIPVNRQTKLRSLNNQLQASAPSPIITLGNLLNSLPNINLLQNRLIAGAIRGKSPQAKYTLLSLSIDEDTLKKKFREYLPHIKTLYIGDDGRKAIWFTQSLDKPQFKTTKIGSDQASIVQYLWQAINEANPDSEAVWINNHLEPYVLYKLSERAWQRGVILISNHPLHLNNGASLVFYTDNKRMGQRLGEMARLMLQKKSLLPDEPLRDLNQGINVRFAKHSGMRIPIDLQKNFQVIK